MSERITKILTFISLLKVEPFMIILAISSFLRKTPLEVLIQDKLCRNVYNMDEEFCLNLPHMSDSEPFHEIKTRILSDAVTYNMYHTWITMTPGILWSIFLGPWIDKYIHGRKAIFIIGSITQSIEAAMNALNSYYFDSHINWILVSFIPYTLSGSMVWTTSYSYVAATTPNKLRTIRMSILEVILAIVSPLGVFFSGRLINQYPIGGNGQLHNYGLIFVLSSCGAFIAFLWAVFMIDQNNDKQLFLKHFPESKSLLKEKLIEDEDELAQNYIYTHPLKLLFNFNNVEEIVMTCIKKRKGYVRAEIWLIIGGMFCSYILHSGPGVFFFQFVEKIYKWDAEIWTQISSIGMMLNSLVVICITPVLIKVFKVNDVILSLIGFCGSFFYLLILGTVLSPKGYFISLLFHSTVTLGPIGYKTHLSKIVEPSELGKVFTLMAVIDGFAPIFAAAVFTLVFDQTIATIPGTCFLILATVTIIPIIIALIIDYINIHTIVEQNNNEYNVKDSYNSLGENSKKNQNRLYPKL